MYTRIIKINDNKSFFLLGPRATGKSTWIEENLKDAIIIDLLDPTVYTRLLAEPKHLEELIPVKNKNWVAIDEIQRIPELLNVVHSLIEKRKTNFALTGSSARKLRRSGTNLLAGRALSMQMFPLTAEELQNDFNMISSLSLGHLPSIFSESDPRKYLASYVQTYLREEVQQEGLTRNLAAFSRFLNAASFSQASVLNISEVARECEIERKTVEGYFSIIEDLLIAVRVPVFTKRAKRKTIAHPKFFFFDVGVYRTLRPAGPLDDTDVIPGASFETLIFQELRAINHYHDLGYDLFYWRTTAGLEVDFILYGNRGLIAIECKSSTKVRKSDLSALKEFRSDYPESKCILFYGGTTEMEIDGVSILPAQKVLPELSKYL